jgi:hypothetical protein
LIEETEKEQENRVRQELLKNISDLQNNIKMELGLLEQAYALLNDGEQVTTELPSEIICTLDMTKGCNRDYMLAVMNKFGHANGKIDCGRLDKAVQDGVFPAPPVEIPEPVRPPVEASLSCF